MEPSSPVSSDEREHEEEVARRMVQAILLAENHAEQRDVVRQAEQWPRGEAASGPWGQALSRLMTRLARLEQLESEFEQALLRDKLAALRELAYGASHEINNPLANISSRAQTLLRDEIDPERRRKLATINSQAFRAYEMISDMMLFAKPPDLDRQSVNLSGVVAQVVDELSEQASEQGTALVVRGTTADCWLDADATHLAVALNALCRNSLEAIGAGGQVTISLVVGDGEVEVRVADTGPGISDEVRQHLFDPFYSGREAGRGLGFGLSKCWRIVQLHGGTIEVVSHGGQPTCFTIRLPRRAESAGIASPPRVA